MKPVPRQWGFLVEDLTKRNSRCKVDLVILDSLAYFLPGHEEQNAAAMTDALRPLRELAASGPGVLLLHHPSKGHRLSGHAARGTGALPAFVDILIEMQWAGQASDDNSRRRLFAWSRHEATPRRILLERSADRLDWQVREDDGKDLIDDIDRIVEEILGMHENATAQQILDEWPQTATRLGIRALSSRLQSLTAFARVERTGAGHRFDPFRYRVSKSPETTNGESPIGATQA